MRADGVGAKMARLILVEPVGEGWSVHSDLADELTFQSGRQAELAAKQLGVQIAERGDRAEIIVYLRDGAVAGRFICTPTLRQSSRGAPCRSVSIALKLVS